MKRREFLQTGVACSLLPLSALKLPSEPSCQCQSSSSSSSSKSTSSKSKCENDKHDWTLDGVGDIERFPWNSTKVMLIEEALEQDYENTYFAVVATGVRHKVPIVGGIYSVDYKGQSCRLIMQVNHKYPLIRLIYKRKRPYSTYKRGESKGFEWCTFDIKFDFRRSCRKCRLQLKDVDISKVDKPEDTTMIFGKAFPRDVMISYEFTFVDDLYVW